MRCLKGIHSSEPNVGNGLVLFEQRRSLIHLNIKEGLLYTWIWSLEFDWPLEFAISLITPYYFYTTSSHISMSFFTTQTFWMYNTTFTVRRKRGLVMNSEECLYFKANQKKIYICKKNTHSWALPMTSWVPIYIVL